MGSGVQLARPVHFLPGSWTVSRLASRANTRLEVKLRQAALSHREFLLPERRHAGNQKGDIVGH